MKTPCLARIASAIVWNAVAGLILTQSHADEVMLLNGDRITGEMIRLDRETCDYGTPYGGTLKLQRSEIQSLRTNARLVVELATGEKVSGTLSCWERTIIMVKSETLGQVTIPANQIARMERLDAPSTRTANTVGDQQMAAIRGAGTGQSPQGKVPAKPIGQRPEDQEEVTKMFLRQTSVLLKPGQAEVEFGVAYERDLQQVIGFSRQTLREFSFPLAFRYGINAKLEGFVTQPVAYGVTELTESGTTVEKSAWGLKDTSFGLNYLLARETAKRPDVILSLSGRAPTGLDPYRNDGTEVGLGNGHWAVSPGLQLVKTFDPVVIFGGVYYTHQFERHALGQDIQPGEEAGYSFGLGFAINEDVSVSAQLLGAFQSEYRLDGSTVSGSSREPVSLRMALTNRWRKGFYVEPSVTFGLNDDAPDFVLGASCIYQFGGK
jgi:hypothetical protein